MRFDVFHTGTLEDDPERGDTTKQSRIWHHMAPKMWQRCAGSCWIHRLGSSGINIFPPFILILCMAGTVAMLQGGLVPCCILLLSFWEMLILTLRSDWCILRWDVHSGCPVLQSSLKVKSPRFFRCREWWIPSGELTFCYGKWPLK